MINKTRKMAILSLCAVMALSFVFALVAPKMSIAIAQESEVVAISNLAELKAFRESVNAGNDYAGKKIVLNADIDLANEAWTPIGTGSNPFNGYFDGQNHTISNLKIDWSKNYVSGGNNQNYAGLFGYMKGGNTAAIKNLTINNADVTGCLYVGVLLGRSYTGGILENCHVTGDVKVDSYAYAGGLVGRHEYSSGSNANGEVMSIYNCSVNANAGSTVNADYAVSYVGGIVGFLAEGNFVIDACSVENVAVTGVYGVGGVSGIAHYGNTISNATVNAVTVASVNNNPASARTNNVGLIAGAVQGTASEPSIFKGNVATATTGSISYTDGTEANIISYFGNTMTGSTPSVATQGSVTPAFTGATSIWGEGGGKASESFEIKLYSDSLLLATASLNNIGGIIDGDVYVSWNIPLNNAGNDEYWNVVWHNYITVDTQPTSVQAWVDGEHVATNNYQLNQPDDLNKFYAATVDANGRFIQYYNNLSSAMGKFNGRTVAVLRDVKEKITGFYGVTLISGVEGGVIITNTYTDEWIDFDDVTVGAGVTLNATDVYSGDSENVILGTLNVKGTFYHGYDAKTTVKDGGKINVDGTTILRYNKKSDSGIYVYGDGDASTVEYACSYYIGAYSSTFYAKDATVTAGYFLLKNSYDNSNYADMAMTLDNSTLTIVGTSDGQNSFQVDDQASLTLVNGSAIKNVRDFNVLAGANHKQVVDSTSKIEAQNMNIASDAKVYNEIYNFAITASSTSVKATESITVTISLDKASYAAEFIFEYDETKFSCAADTDNDGEIYVYSFENAAGALKTYTLTALNDITKLTKTMLTVSGDVVQRSEHAISGVKNIVNSAELAINISLNYSATVHADYVTGYSLVVISGIDAGYAYAGVKMIYVTDYNAFAIIVEGAVTADKIEANLTKAANCKEITKSGYNVNVDFVADGKVDLKDATAAYACSIIDFSVADYMELYLRADVNGDNKVDVNDVNAIIAAPNYVK